MRASIRFNGWATLVLLFAFSWNANSSQNNPDTKRSLDGEDKQVVMFSATYCPACGHAKAFFKENDISYTEFDIETSVAARTYFERLGGQGTPLLLINNRRMHGFDEVRFWHYYKQDKPQ